MTLADLKRVQDLYRDGRTRWDYSELEGCVSNLRRWQDNNADGIITGELNRDLTLVLDWFVDMWEGGHGKP